MSVPRKESILRLHEVSVSYPGGIRALDTVSIGFRKGEFAVLLGASGAGKSTLLRTLNHTVAPTGGHVESPELGPLVSGRVLRLHRRRTAMVFQHHQLIERYTALQNVLTGRLAYYSTWRSFFPLPCQDQILALHCLERVGLLNRALTRVDQLSGGQKQRVGIARALAQQPTVILADEPVASLDPGTAGKMLGLLKRICEEDGITAIVSLHQLEYARRFADRIIGIADARIVFDGGVEELGEEDLAHIYAAGRNPAQPASAHHRAKHFQPNLKPEMEISL